MLVKLESLLLVMQDFLPLLVSFQRRMELEMLLVGLDWLLVFFQRKLVLELLSVLALALAQSKLASTELVGSDFAVSRRS